MNLMAWHSVTLIFRAEFGCLSLLGIKVLFENKNKKKKFETTFLVTYIPPYSKSQLEQVATLKGMFYNILVIMDVLNR